MTSREQILFNLLQEARSSFRWIEKEGKDLREIKSYANSRANAIKTATFGFAYGASSKTIRKMLIETRMTQEEIQAIIDESLVYEAPENLIVAESIFTCRNEGDVQLGLRALLRITKSAGGNCSAMKTWVHVDGNNLVHLYGVSLHE